MGSLVHCGILCINNSRKRKVISQIERLSLLINVFKSFGKNIYRNPLNISNFKRVITLFV